MKDMIQERMNQPNILMDIGEYFKHLYSDCNWNVDPIIACINPSKHTTVIDFAEVNELEAHIKTCFGFKGNLCLNEKNDENNSDIVLKKVEVN